MSDCACSVVPSDREACSWVDLRVDSSCDKPLSGLCDCNESLDSEQSRFSDGGSGAKPPLNLSRVNKSQSFSTFLANYDFNLFQRYSSCHSKILCFRDIDTDLGVVSPNSCSVRGCPTCGGYQVARLYGRYLPKCRDAKRLKKVELTSGHDVNSAEELRAFGDKCGKVLSRFWNSWFMALEISSTGHVHCHALVDGSWVSQRALSAEADRVIGKPVVWISRSKPSLLRYLIKDCVKLATLVDDAKRIAFFVLTRGVRMFRSRGFFYRIGSDAKKISRYLVYECTLPLDSIAGRYWLRCVEAGIPPPSYYLSDA